MDLPGKYHKVDAYDYVTSRNNLKLCASWNWMNEETPTNKVRYHPKDEGILILFNFSSWSFKEKNLNLWRAYNSYESKV